MTRRAEAPLLARKGDKKIMRAFRASYPGKAISEIPAFKELFDHVAHNRSPEAKVGLVSTGVHALEFVKVIFDELIKRSSDSSRSIEAGCGGHTRVGVSHREGNAQSAPLVTRVI